MHATSGHVHRIFLRTNPAGIQSCMQPVFRQCALARRAEALWIRSVIFNTQAGCLAASLAQSGKGWGTKPHEKCRDEDTSHHMNLASRQKRALERTNSVRACRIAIVLTVRRAQYVAKLKVSSLLYFLRHIYGYAHALLATLRSLWHDSSAIGTGSGT
eukprot:6175149-Pleurochrysis_carterae.AAC.1